MQSSDLILAQRREAAARGRDGLEWSTQMLVWLELAQGL